MSDFISQRKFSNDFLNQKMGETYNSYLEYKTRIEESKLISIIREKYLKVLGEFIENMYPGLKFNIHIKHRSFTEKKIDWFGYTYMELVIYDVISLPMYNQSSFDPSYKTKDYSELISSYDFYETIDSFIPEINKHLLISFFPARDLPVSQMMYNMLDIPSFECWSEYYKRQIIKSSQIR